MLSFIILSVKMVSVIVQLKLNKKYISKCQVKMAVTLLLSVAVPGS